VVSFSTERCCVSLFSFLGNLTWLRKNNTEVFFSWDIMPRRVVEEMKPQLHRSKNLKPRRNITLFVRIQAVETEIVRIVSMVSLE
jgi:hypothetical protein